MTGLIVDDFSEGFDPHGDRVRRAYREHDATGPITEHDVGATVASSVELLAPVNDWLDTEPEPLHVNLSWGSDSITDPDDGNALAAIYWRKAWQAGCAITVSAGNDHSQGVNSLAVSPYCWAVGALARDGWPADFSQHHPRIVGIFAPGAGGTSFAAPRVGGAIAEARRRLGLTQPQARSLVKATANPLTFTDPDDGREYHYWTLNAGRMRAATGVPGIDARLTVFAAYHAYLGRQPEGAGLDYWTQRAQANGLDDALPALLHAAKDGGDWMADQVPIMDRVQALYHLHFAREADTAGLSWWVDQVLAVDGNAGSFAVRPASYTSWPAITRAFVQGDAENARHLWALNLLG